LPFFFLAWAQAAFQEQILRCDCPNPEVINQLWESGIDVQGSHDGFVDVRVQKANDLVVIQALTTCEVVVANLEEETLKFLKLNNAARAKSAAPPNWFTAYRTYDELTAYYRNLSVQYPTVVTWNASIGTTQEGRALFAVRLFDRTGNANRQPSQRIYWTGQIHAREWIAGATVNYLVDSLLLDLDRKPNADPLIQSILQRTEIIVVPIINPDGYVYSWLNTSTRQWRKNRKTNPGSTCIGVDENRNFNDHWNGGGSSSNPCDDTYMGPSAASENEVRAVQNYFIANQGVPIVGAIDWHSYSQLVLRPYGWSNSLCPDETILKSLGDKYAADILANSSKVYTSQRSIQLYVTSGTASDWYYGDQAFAGNKGYRVASYTVELRPTGNPPGFVLPPAEIVPTGQENYAAIRNWLDYLNKSPIFRP